MHVVSIDMAPTTNIDEEHSDLIFRSDFSVELVDHMGDDSSVLDAMLVSTLTDDTVETMTIEDAQRKINFLMKNRHSSPFEHNSMKFRVEAPIFVYREWHRHRIGISINEQSGRYTKFEPAFYIPPRERNLIQVGKPGAYAFEPAPAELHEWLVQDMKNDYSIQWQRYEERLERGIAKEAARMSLGVGIYSTMYWTCNARSLMAFLSLRTKAEPFWIEEVGSEHPEPGPFFFQNPGGSMFPSFPMWEIQICADALEEIFKWLFPLTHRAFNEFGRVGG